MTLLDSGLNDEQVLGLFGLVAFEQAILSKRPEWTAELNKRRFELIDGDIQGTLTREEKQETDPARLVSRKDSKTQRR